MLDVPPDARILIILCWSLYSLLMILKPIFYLLLKINSTLPVFESSLDTLSFVNFKPVPPFELHEVTDSEVSTLIELMDPRKAKGEDGIAVQFSKAYLSGMARLIRSSIA